MAAHTWNFFRAGDFDQVKLETGADLLALPELDQKLWVALSCPTRGIEFDPRTLDLIDSDGDGQVRAHEVLAAIDWAAGLLKNPDLLINGSDRLALTDIDESTEEGKQIYASAWHILKSLGKSAATKISLADMADIEKFMAGQEFNGDGVICAERITDAALRTTIEDIIKCAGAATDLSGATGINQELADKFFTRAAAYADWYAKGEANADILLLGAQTYAAAAAFHAVKDKASDYFTRCQLAAYDARAAAPLSRAAEDYQRVAAQSLSAQSEEIAGFPLALVEAGKPLPLQVGVNPAWLDRLTALREQVIVPLLGNKDQLDAAEWAVLCARFTAFEAWQAEKPADGVEQLGIDRIRVILRTRHKAAIDDLIAQDKAVEAKVKAIHSVERLLRYNRDLFRLVKNFVSFHDFYTGKEKATFQVGTLYLDGRSCELCFRVEDVTKHASFASTSGVCLVYCDCVRSGGAEKISIAAAFTAGDSDFLAVGRNGVFYDRKGQDWNATIVRIIEHPISVRQAFWYPYKKFSRMLGEQFQKLAASRASSIDEKLLKAAVESSKAPAAAPAPAAPAAQPFDVGKFAGIFAAIGLAIGAIGGFLASLVSGILALKFWQIPFALIGIMLLISGPSMAMAWFKLRRRHLGPVLDACGWAINAHVHINIPFGTSLTGVAQLPQEANRSLVDPFAQKHPLWPYYVVIALGVCALIGLWYVGFFGHTGLDNPK
ncbi:MAG TPA: hypothetical protein VFK88_07870 [Gallionella sp.]|nr:hypothetical protein [Gallionella sp.]